MRIKLLSICILLFLFSYQPIYAGEPVFVDDFSQGFGKWEDTRNTFDYWSIIDLQAQAYITTSSKLAELVPKDEYWNPEWKNIIYSLDYTYLQGADKNISFWYKDPKNWYEIHFIGGSYIISHVKNGVVVWDTTGGYSPEGGKKYHMEFVLNEGNIQLYVNTVKMIDVTDPTFADDYGKIGIKAGAGSIYPTRVLYDNIKVSLIEPTQENTVLEIPEFKQTDPLWSQNEYDMAEQWSPNKKTIADWGCLITSLAMVLNYHDITTLPSGDPLTPLTLNTWLHGQPDGYIANGLVNWSAVTRLVREISDLNGTTKLEYQRFNGNNIDIAKREITAGQPAILEIPGHFFIANGILSNPEDIAIIDPLLPYAAFSEHQQPLRSTRTLVPSFTDLSYIHLAHTSDIQVAVTANNSINYQTYVQSLTSSDKLTQSPEYQLHEISKPDSGEYTVTITSPEINGYTLTIFAYDKNGSLTNLTYDGVASPSPTTLTITYDKEGKVSLHSQINYLTLVNDISVVATDSIYKRYVASELKKWAQTAHNSSQKNKKRYVPALHEQVEWYRQYLSPNAYTILQKRIEEIKNQIDRV